MQISHEAPETKPAVGGLLSVVKPITDFDPSAFYTGVSYESALDVIPRPIPTNGSEKTFDDVANVETVKFGVYSGIERAMLVNTGNAGVEESHKRGMSTAVESNVQTLLLNPEAVDLTPAAGTAVTDPRFALGILEQFIAEKYRGRPILHANRFAVTLLRDLEIDTSNWEIHTTQGTPVANGAGYSATGPAGAVAAAGEAWLYISGQVNLWEGPTTTTDGRELKSNKRHVLIETEFLANIDGPVGAILLGIA